MSKPKAINEITYAHRDFLEHLVATVNDLPEDVQTVEGVVRVWDDPAWGTPESRLQLAQYLAALTKRKILKRVAYGQYAVSGGYSVRGLGSNHQVERIVLAFLRENGGIARWREIMRHFGVTEKEGGGPLRRQIETSTKINRDFSVSTDNLGLDSAHEDRGTGGRGQRKRSIGLRISNKAPRLTRHTGYYNLPIPELDASIMQGRWVGLHMKLVMMAQPATTAAIFYDRTVPWDDMTDEHLRRVGQTFTKVRELNGYGCYDVAEDHRMALAIDAAIDRMRINDMLTFLRKWPDPVERRAVFLKEFEGGEDVEFDETGTPITDDLGEPVLVDSFKRNHHIVVRDDFYYAFADIFNLHAPALSRGVTMVGMTEHDWTDAAPIDFSPYLAPDFDPYEEEDEEVEDEPEYEVTRTVMEIEDDPLRPTPAQFFADDDVEVADYGTTHTARLGRLKQMIDLNPTDFPLMGDRQHAVIWWFIDTHRTERLIWLPDDLIEHGLSAIFKRRDLHTNLKPLVESRWLERTNGAYRIGQGEVWGTAVEG